MKIKKLQLLDSGKKKTGGKIICRAGSICGRNDSDLGPFVRTVNSEIDLNSKENVPGKKVLIWSTAKYIVFRQKLGTVHWE